MYTYHFLLFLKEKCDTVLTILLKMNNKVRLLDMNSRLYYIVIVNFFIDASGFAVEMAGIRVWFFAAGVCLS